MRQRMDRAYIRQQELTRERDVLARDAIENGMTWEAVQRALGLSRRGIQIVLARTKPSQGGEDLPAEEGDG